MDVRIDTAPGVQFITSLSQNLYAEAHLRLRGTPSRPGMLGRIAVTQGDVVFFGTKYTVNRGNVQFFNPQRILPVLDVDLAAQAKGVEVILSVTGPMDNLRFNYRSDPPMLFSDLVSLLASGKTPTTDPVLAARAPPAGAEPGAEGGIHAARTGSGESGFRAFAAPVRGEQAENRPADHRRVEYAAGHNDSATANYARPHLHVYPAGDSE
jgi:hypothetical protein